MNKFFLFFPHRMRINEKMNGDQAINKILLYQSLSKLIFHQRNFHFEALLMEIGKSSVKVCFKF